VTRGGISTNEINQKTMESKFINGLYFCGEVIDVDAPTGGFNLQTGLLLGQVYIRLKRKRCNLAQNYGYSNSLLLCIIVS
jgi:hypothetical protein